MRKAKFELYCKVPSWNYCNLDVYTADSRYSKQKCRFCIKEKSGHRCVLYNQALTSDPTFVHKTAGCIKATAGFTEEVKEAPMPTIDPKMIVRETLKEYQRVLNDLLKQGYPQHLAEKITMEYVTGEGSK